MQNRTVISFLLACTTVVGGVVMMNRSILKLPGSILAATTSKTYQPFLHKVPEPTTQPRSVPLPITQGDVTPSSVVKCIVNGKTSYTNKACPTGAKTHQVELHDTAGVVSPPKEVLADLTARRIASEQAYSQHLQQQASLSVQSKKTECEQLLKHIDWLDGMARQPQSGQMQDWIKVRKVETQSRQYTIHC